MSSEEYVDKIIELYKSGLSGAKIAKQVPVSATQIRRILNKNKVEARSNRTNNDLENTILNRYKSGESSEKIAEDLGMNGSTICRIVKRLGGEIRASEDNKRTYNIRSDFFKNIDSENKAYWLGFLFADGNVSSRSGCITLSLHRKDEDAIIKLINDIYIDGKEVKYYNDKYSYVNIYSAEMKEDLIKLGCVPNKTFKVTLPSLRDDLMRHFFRGLYDGDGCISVSKQSDERVRVMVDGYTEFLKEIKVYFEKLGIICGNISISDSNEKVASLTISNKESLIKVLDYFYNGSTIYLDRKYLKYKEALVFLNKQHN